MTAPFATSEALAAIAGIRHGFFGRAGGVSEGDYASLNCGPGSADEPDAVIENRARAMAALELPAEALYTARQVHGTNAIVLDARCAPRRLGDALATAVPGIALGILTADCAPVLFADPGARVVGAAHAGWRGALDGVLGAAVSAMEALGAERARIVAAVGPCIGQASYEVGSEFRDRFEADDEDNARWFTRPLPGERPRFDLESYVGARLAALGVARVTVAGADTCAEEELYFSYRRACLRGKAGYGRALSAIALME
ncbi:MAG: peptidoglycan editing factor PgeF [Defluviicoccus sp.]|nr:peptidoglycan editing factor PgeF [Defluviicoccus sp.]MDE0277325.1 peptidoglycan editing factor PgeF [Defluviicoccus sp.]